MVFIITAMKKHIKKLPKSSLFRSLPTDGVLLSGFHKGGSVLTLSTFMQLRIYMRFPIFIFREPEALRSHPAIIS